MGSVGGREHNIIVFVVVPSLASKFQKCILITKVLEGLANVYIFKL